MAGDNQALGLSGKFHVRILEYLESFPKSQMPKNIYTCIMGDLEKTLLETVLHCVKYNQIKAAEILGINRNTLRRKIKLHQIAILK